MRRSLHGEFSNAGGLPYAECRGHARRNGRSAAQGRRYVDLEGAHEMIDMLDALREKTRGNLAKVDEDLLMEVIGSLKTDVHGDFQTAAAEMVKHKAQKKFERAP